MKPDHASIMVMLLLSICSRAPASITLHRTDSIHIPGGIEILSFDHVSQKIYGIGPIGNIMFHLDDDGMLSVLSSQTLARYEPWEPTSIAVDPAGRGFAATSWIPRPADRVEGIVQIMDTSSDRVIHQFNVGYHPDCIAFTPDGRSLLIANECEPGAEDRAGALTIVDLSKIRTPEDFRGVPDTQSFDFTASNLAPGVSLDAIRIHPALRQTPEIDIEPEYLAPTNEGVWVSLQENNALGYFDFTEHQWTRVLPLEPLSFPFDGSDRDGINISTHTGFMMMPQPDTIGSIVIEGARYIVTANEGEGGDTSIIKLHDAMDIGLIDQSTLERLGASNTPDELEAMGKIRISAIDGDLDRDGDLDLLMTTGGRSISILEASSGSVVWNSGSHLERLTASKWPDRFNSNDSRSDQSGPEPEGIALGWMGDRALVIIGLERSDAVVMYDITDPTAPVYLDAQPLQSECRRPEGLAFINTDHGTYLAVASEVGGCITIFEIHDDDQSSPVK